MATLRFSPTAWAKLLYIASKAKTEVSGFAITSPENSFYIQDFKLIKQQCTSVTTEMDEDGIDSFFGEMLDAGLQPRDFSRIWIHTHPGMAPSPSGTDLKTFDELFKDCSYGIMFILGKNNEVYCKGRWNKIDAIGSIEQNLDCIIDYTSAEFKGTNFEAWQTELKNHVFEPVSKIIPYANRAMPRVETKSFWYNGWNDFDYEDKEDYDNFAKANDLILKEEKNKNLAELDNANILKGRLKKLVDKLSDFEKMTLIDEINRDYDLEYLEDISLYTQEDLENEEKEDFLGK